MNEKQERILNLFKKVRKVLYTNNLPFFALGGTTIGAVRHKGFIPWDDDIDLGMRRTDFDKLVNFINNDVLNNKEIEWICPMDINNANSILKVVDIDSKTKYYDESSGLSGLFIDIFPLDEAPKSSLRKAMHFYRCKILNVVIRSRVNPGSDDSTFKATVKKAIKAPFAFINTDRLKKKLYKLQSKKYNSDVLTNYAGPYSLGKDDILVSELSELIEIQFEDTVIPIPAKFDSILTRTYGDYMTLPKVENQRGGHISEQ